MFQRTILITFFLLALSLEAQTKYYTVKAEQPTNNWRDSLFVVKVSDPVVQQDFANELALPFDQRDKIVNAQIAAGSGSFNKNGTHCFNWHMIDSTVGLADTTIELCDGRPYSDVELNDFVNTVGQYCPWGMVLNEEVSNPVCNLSIEDPELDRKKIKVHPNPANNRLYFYLEVQAVENMQIAIFNTLGEMVYFEAKNKKIPKINISELSTGYYYLSLKVNDREVAKTFIKQN